MPNKTYAERTPLDQSTSFVVPSGCVVRQRGEPAVALRVTHGPDVVSLIQQAAQHEHRANLQYGAGCVEPF
jgi:hypothetical protein